MNYEFESHIQVMNLNYKYESNSNQTQITPNIGLINSNQT